MISKKVFTLLVLFCTFPLLNASAYWVWSPESGKFINPEGTLQDESQEQYDYAMGFYKEKNLDEAAEQLETLLRKYPGSPPAAEAQYRLGTIYEEKGDYLKAYESYKKLVESYPNSERFKEVIEREFRIGNLFLSGKKAKFMGLEILPSLPKAAEVFNHITKNAPYSEFGDQAQYHLGIAYKRQGRFSDAAEAFQGLIDQYPQSELVSKARFEIAEVSYKRSATHFRDQRALDDAATQVDRYLSRYSGEEMASPAETERAEKLRQIIDEKNAEKNYRVGLYYEKQKYIQSAVIYYEDTQQRYPHTKWGKKAASRLQALESPADYHAKRSKEVEAQLESLRAQLDAAQNKEDRNVVKKRIERIEKHSKVIEKEKKDTFKNREDDIKRREAELKEKFKKLKKKREQAKDNTSTDFQRAMGRWHASLVREQEALMREKEQMAGWKTSMGMDKKGFSLEPLPFFGDSDLTELERVQRIDAKKLYQISEEKRELLEEKETLYKQMGEVSSLLETEQIAVEVNLFEEHDELKAQQQKLKELQSIIKQTEAELQQKKDLVKDRPGESKIAKTISFLNPFDSPGRLDLDKAPVDQLLETRMHQKEKVSSQQYLVETLSQAFDAELAMKEQRRILEKLQSEEKVDPKKLRKSIKVLEKDIRKRYQDIQDRHEVKKAKLAELETLSQSDRAATGFLKKTGRVVTAPAKVAKAFLFGMPSEREKVDEKVQSIEDGRAAQLREEIELESLVIEANSREIISLERKLEILKARASLAGGLKFRSAFVEVPYAFLEDAIESAKSMIPRKERDEILIEKLEKETQKLEAYRAQLARIEEKISKRSPESAKPAEDPSVTEFETQLKDLERKLDPEEGVPTPMLRKEVEVLTNRLESQKRAYDLEKDKLKQDLKQVKALKAENKKEVKRQEEAMKKVEKNQKELKKNLGKIQDHLTKLIEKETKLESQETEILEKRIMQIDKVMGDIKSRALSQDLLTERDRIEKRLSQITLRQDFLSKEVERFQVKDAASSVGAAA